jgi:hypothetical protein
LELASGWARRSDARADAADAAPIVVTLIGNDEVRVRVAEGSVSPCDSPSNTLLHSGKIKPGDVVKLTTSAECVCVEQTYHPFPVTQWSQSWMACRPQICEWKPGKKKSVRVCRPDPDPTIRIVLTSSTPSG